MDLDLKVLELQNQEKATPRYFLTTHPVDPVNPAQFFRQDPRIIHTMGLFYLESLFAPSRLCVRTPLFHLQHFSIAMGGRDAALPSDFSIIHPVQFFRQDPQDLHDGTLSPFISLETLLAPSRLCAFA